VPLLRGKERDIWLAPPKGYRALKAAPVVLPLKG
jgi:hypothetical protein